ncbi:LAMI_0F07822g1_1 [Lachancea mirantina]|uniref:LAMI_0F07822g1_1 n=1 Tax=Lachancea mirantina TaxID=1230905 RepID=A0A1G4JZX4_9SACH|nr:LAMI_0F07822g1_1 [Lachancea mirantina]
MSYQAIGEDGQPSSASKLTARRRKLVVPIFALLGLVGLLSGLRLVSTKKYESCYKCETYEAIAPAFDKSLNQILYNAHYKDELIEKLSGAIRIPTEIYDWTPQPSQDLKAWKQFFKFHQYLNSTFPTLHDVVRLEKIDRVGLLYTWEGSNPDLKPLLLMAHQDVVPVEPETVNKWAHPPFGGYYDRESDMIYGRGSADIKILVISHLEAVEKLIKDGFKPKRTILISFGCDEEASGSCAGKIAEHIEARYGADSLYAILDEGGGVTQLQENVFLGVPVTSEKGYLDAEITLNTPGGHSSVPPDHTSIGVISDLIVSLESDIDQIKIDPGNPALFGLSCYLGKADKGDKNLKRLLDSGRLVEFGKEIDKNTEFKYLFKSSQAIDMIEGGIKANALPETVTALVNNRISLTSSVNNTVERILNHMKSKARRFDVGIKIVEGRDALEDHAKVVIPPTDHGHFLLRLIDALEPAPVSPTDEVDVWRIMAGTTTNTYQQSLFGGADNTVFVSPFLGTGNTDTKSFWNLTRNIYRYSGGLISEGANEHTVDEKNSGKALVSSVAFMYQFIPNTDQYSTEK